MAKPDMSSMAVTVRLLRTAQLRRLCIQLGRGRKNPTPARPKKNQAPSK